MSVDIQKQDQSQPQQGKEGIYDYRAEISQSDGRFRRSESVFRNWVRNDPNAEFPAEAHRYTVFYAHACPWAGRVLTVRRLKGLEDAIGAIGVDWYLGPKGWRFGYEGEQDTVSGLNAQYLRELYLQTDPNYTGKVTVPTLYDHQQKKVVNNESADIIQMFNTEFNHVAKNPQLDLYPQNYREQIDAINAKVYEHVNNGVYKCGFAGTQEAYEEAFHNLFQTLDELEQILSQQRYLVKGPQDITLADVRLFPTLIRFDPVYFTHFKCNKRQLKDYPHLYNYMKEIYQRDGIRDTFNIEQTKKHYYGSHTSINPKGIVPVGPEINYDEPHNRDQFPL